MYVQCLVEVFSGTIKVFQLKDIVNLTIAVSFSCLHCSIYKGFDLLQGPVQVDTHYFV